MYKKTIAIIISCAAALSFSACSEAEKAPFEMLDGNAALMDDVTENNDKDYALDLCFAVPYGTPKDDRKTGSGSWKQLKENSDWNGFTVTKAVSRYGGDMYDNPSYVYLQEVHLKGSITLNGTASYLDKEREMYTVHFELDEESRRSLPSLTPYYEPWSTPDEKYTDENIYFTFGADSEYYQQIADELEEKDSVSITVTAEEFMLQYSEIGTVTDGITNGTFEKITSFEIKS